MAPLWFTKFRQTTFSAYLVATVILMAIFYTQRDKV